MYAYVPMCCLLHIEKQIDQGQFFIYFVQNDFNLDDSELK